MKKTASFVIDVIDTKNHTWQGKIHWVQEKRTASFRSALELMQLLSSAVTPEEALKIQEATEHEGKVQQISKVQ